MSIYSKSRGRLGIAALAAFGMTFCLPAAAQSADDEAEAADEDSLVEEIVVTATYRDTQLMDTPLTISALTDVDIEQRGVEDIKNLFLAIPGLNYGNATQTWLAPGHGARSRAVQVPDRTDRDVCGQYSRTGHGQPAAAASEFRPGAHRGA